MAGTIKINQSAFIQDLVLEKRLTNCNADVIPMKAGLSIKMSDLEDYKEGDLYTYQRIIGKWMYFAHGTCLNITFVMRQLSKQKVNPRKGHLQVAKKVVRYLKDTKKMGLIFG